jgi:hypothetical protein
MGVHNLNTLEETFVRKHQELHAAAKEAAIVRKALTDAYMTRHPDIPFTVTVMEDNILDLDIVFPGIGRARSRQLAQEIRAYITSLLQEDK